MDNFDAMFDQNGDLAPSSPVTEEAYQRYWDAEGHRLAHLFSDDGAPPSSSGFHMSELKADGAENHNNALPGTSAATPYHNSTSSNLNAASSDSQTSPTQPQHLPTPLPHSSEEAGAPSPVAAMSDFRQEDTPFWSRPSIFRLPNGIEIRGTCRWAYERAPPTYQQDTLKDLNEWRAQRRQQQAQQVTHAQQPQQAATLDMSTSTSSGSRPAHLSSVASTSGAPPSSALGLSQSTGHDLARTSAPPLRATTGRQVQAGPLLAAQRDVNGKFLRSKCTKCSRDCVKNGHNDGALCTGCYNKATESGTKSKTAGAQRSSSTPGSDPSQPSQFGGRPIQPRGLAVVIPYVSGDTSQTQQGDDDEQPQEDTEDDPEEAAVGDLPPPLAINIGQYSQGMVHTSAAAAKSYTIQPPAEDCEQVTLDPEDPDDWPAVKNERYDELCLQLQAALCQPPPLTIKKHHKSIVTAFTATRRCTERPEGRKMVQANVMVAISTAVAMHEVGIAKVGASSTRGIKPDYNLKCSARVSALIEVVRECPYTKKNLAEGKGIDDMVRNPADYRQRKLNNKHTNDIKSTNLALSAAVKKAQAGETDTAPKKRGRPRKTAAPSLGQGNISSFPAYTPTENDGEADGLQPSSSMAKKRARVDDNPYSLESDEDHRHTRVKTTHGNPGLDPMLQQYDAQQQQDMTLSNTQPDSSFAGQAYSAAPFAFGTGQIMQGAEGQSQSSRTISEEVESGVLYSGYAADAQYQQPAFPQNQQATLPQYQQTSFPQHQQSTVPQYQQPAFAQYQQASSPRGPTSHPNGEFESNTAVSTTHDDGQMVQGASEELGGDGQAAVPTVNASGNFDFLAGGDWDVPADFDVEAFIGYGGLSGVDGYDAPGGADGSGL